MESTITFEHKYMTGDIVFTASLNLSGVEVHKWFITGIRINHHSDITREGSSLVLSNPIDTVSYTAVKLDDICLGCEQYFNENELFITPEAALKHQLERIRENVEKSSVYATYYKENPNIHV